MVAMVNPKRSWVSKFQMGGNTKISGSKSLNALFGFFPASFFPQTLASASLVPGCYAVQVNGDLPRDEAEKVVSPSHKFSDMHIFFLQCIETIC
jgi:hypothetical protein